MEILISWAVAYAMGAGWLYVVLFVFALAFPRLFRVLYWLFMFPVMFFGSTPFGWLFLGFFMGWGEDTLKIAAFFSAIFAFLFCKWTDPKPAS